MSPHPESEYGLRVQLATALRERDLAVRVADGKSAELTETLAALAAANAKAEKVEAAAAAHQEARIRLARERNGLREALAAARRECEELRRALIELSKIPPADPGHVFTLYAFELARKALAAPAAASTPRKHWPDCALNHGGTACDMGPDCGTEGYLDSGGTWRVAVPAAAAGEEGK